MLTLGDVMLLVSASGDVNAIIGAPEINAGFGATTLCITRPGTRFAAACTVPIWLDMPTDRDIHKPNAARYMQMIVVEALTMAAARVLVETTEDLRRIHASLMAYHGGTGPPPPGD